MINLCLMKVPERKAISKKIRLKFFSEGMKNMPSNVWSH